MRINLSTKPEEIIKTMIKEIPLERYLFYKNYGGKRKYFKHENRLVDKALKEKEPKCTELSEHISKCGNRWITYTNVAYFPKALYALAFNISFIYYETYGSCGAFFPTYSNVKIKGRNRINPNGVIIYTSHFFLRMSERTGKAYKSKELIKEFISSMIGTASQTDKDNDVIVKFKGGYGFGKEKSKSPRVVEIRTYLTDGQLSPKQKRKCEKVNAFHELISDGMYIKDIALNTALNTYNDREELTKIVTKKLDAVKKLGMYKPLLYLRFLVSCFTKMIHSILNVEIPEYQIATVNAVMIDCAKDFIVKWMNVEASKMAQTKEEYEEFKQDFIEVMVKCAEKLKLKKVNRETIVEYIDKIHKNN